tara:strand:+ start:2827 stop:3465 length:639 start_codon:yes stop_codon:yes gene_type:complete
MPFENNQRITRRRSSAGPTPPRKINGDSNSGRQNQGPRPTFLTLRDHGKVYVADLPNLSDGQLGHISKESNEVLNSLETRLYDLEQEVNAGTAENDTLIKASTKRDVTQRFIRAIEEEQSHRKNNPALKDAASESLPRTFLEVARHRLPGATFDSLLREALSVCAAGEEELQDSGEEPLENDRQTVRIMDIPASQSVPVVVNLDSSINIKNA